MTALPTSWIFGARADYLGPWADSYPGSVVAGVDTYGVGADPDPSTKVGAKLRTLLDTAWAASSAASDSGAIVFAEHTGHVQAMRDNRAARRAWAAVASLAGGYPREKNAPEITEDAQARIGELDVAAQAIAFDSGTHRGVLVPKRFKVRNKGLLPGLGGALNEGGLPGQPTSKLRVGLVAAAAAAATKLLGWW